MSKEVVEHWYNSLPRIERESGEPLVAYMGKAYSAREILAEVNAGTRLGEELQRIIELKRFTSVEDRYALGILRLKERLKKLPKEFRLVFNGKMYSPEEMLKEVQEGTKVGRALVEAEIRRVEEILGKK